MSGRRWILLLLALPFVTVAAGLVVLWFSYQPSGGGQPLDPAIFNRVVLALVTMVVGAAAAWFVLRNQ